MRCFCVILIFTLVLCGVKSVMCDCNVTAMRCFCVSHD